MKQEVINEAAELLHKAHRVVFLTGAGMSAESGIATFRGSSNSFWAGMVGTLSMAYFGTPVGWKWTPAMTWKLYCTNFYGEIAKAQPNPGHYAVAELQKLKESVIIVTQNVDGLHQTAGCPLDTVLEIHGTVREHRCIKNGHKANPDEEALQGRIVPRCTEPGCGSYLRPDAVLFTENLPDDEWLKSLSAVRSLRQSSNDVFVVVGTSGIVQPAASLAEIARSRGIPIIELNLKAAFSTQDGANSRGADVFVEGPAGKTLPAILTRMQELKQ